MITGLYLSFAAVMLVFLSIRVISIRRGDKISIGTGGNPDLERAIRVHGNFIEYTPIILLLLVVAEMNGLPAIGVHIFGLLFITSRVFHFIGFSSNEGPMILRVLGMVMTFALLLLLAGLVTGQYIGLLTS